MSIISTAVRFLVNSFVSGLVDSFHIGAIRMLFSDKEARNALINTIKLNVFLLLGVTILIQLCLPVFCDWQGVGEPPRWLVYTTDAILFVVFVAPVYTLALLYNVDYYAIITQRVLLRLSRTQSIIEPESVSFIRKVEIVIDTIRGILLPLMLMVIASCLRYIPQIGTPLSFVYTCWINSFSCFDYKWTLLDSQSTLESRIVLFERLWVYMLGFGFPHSVLFAWLPSTWALCFYAVFFRFSYVLLF